MTLELELIAALQSQCPRVLPVVAPYSTPTPYVTWQHVGGRPLRYLDNSAADKRNAYIQVNVWADTSLQAITLARAIEDALCAWPGLIAVPQGETVDAYDEGDERKGTVQTFSVWGAR
ncbi:MAG: hypothetical protein JWP29_1086 [Rhodoferax sp.]|nr:hypothetical protein [Rhodoferax sp.]